MLSSHTKQLVHNLNDIKTQLKDSPEQVELSVKQAQVMLKLAKAAKQQNEKLQLVYGAIALLEGLAFTECSRDEYHAQQKTLGLAYVAFSRIKDDTRFLSVARKLLKPLSASGDIEVWIELLHISALLDEMALAHFYARKVLAHDELHPRHIDMLNLPVTYKRYDWYKDLMAATQMH